MMQKRLIVIIISVFFIFNLTGCSTNIDENGSSHLSDSAKLEDKNKIIDSSMVTFKDISFIGDASTFSTRIYDKNYVLANKILYDFDGNVLFDGSDYSLVEYINGYLKVKKNYKVGVIGKDFNVLIPLKYNDVEIKSDECFFLQNINESNTVITNIYNPKTKKMYEPFFREEYFSDELIVVEKYIGDNVEELSGWVESKKFETYILNIKEDILERKKDFDNYSFITSEVFQDNYIIAFEFKYGVIDNKGNIIIPFKYDSIKNIGDKYLLLEKNDNYNLVTIDNNSILSFMDKKHFDIYLINDVIIIVRDNNVTEYYTSQGKLIYKSEKEYSTIEYIGGNKYILYDKDKCLYIDLTNNKINTKEIDYSYCSDLYGRSEQGYIVKENENGKVLCNNKLEPIFKNIYDSIYLYDCYCIVKKDNVYKILSYDEKELVQKEFKECYGKGDNGVLVQDNLNNKYYFCY